MCSVAHTLIPRMYGAVRDEWRASEQVSQSVLHKRKDAVVIPTQTPGRRRPSSGPLASSEVSLKCSIPKSGNRSGNRKMKNNKMDFLEARRRPLATADDLAPQFVLDPAGSLGEWACGCAVQHLSPPPSMAFGCCTVQPRSHPSNNHIGLTTDRG